MAQHDFEIPDGLSAEGKRAARALIDLAGAEATGGGCRAFYTPAEWRARGEEYGLTAELIVVHDGGAFAPMLNLDYQRYDDYDKVVVALSRVGTWVEACTCWYSAVYRSDQ